MRNLRITLRYGNIEYVLDDPIPKINDNSIDEEKVAHAKHVDDSNKVPCIMIVAMASEPQKAFKNT